MIYAPALETPQPLAGAARSGGPTAQSLNELRREAIREGRIEDATEYGRMMQILDDRAFAGRGISGLLTAALVAPLLCLPFWIFHIW